MKNIPDLKPKYSNELITRVSKRPDGSTNVEYDYSQCENLTEQHTANLTDINYLIKKYTPDELSIYLASKFRQPIEGWDFSKEPNLQESMNEIYRLKQAFQAFPEEIKNQFKNYADFVKYADNPANFEKLVKLGLIEQKPVPEKEPTTNEILNQINKKLKNDDDQTTTKTEIKKS